MFNGKKYTKPQEVFFIPDDRLGKELLGEELYAVLKKILFGDSTGEVVNNEDEREYDFDFIDAEFSEITGGNT